MNAAIFDYTPGRNLRKGLRGWWLSPPRPGIYRLIAPWEYRHLRFFGAGRIAGGSAAAAAGVICLSLRRLRMGSLLPGSCGAESRGWLLVPHGRSRGRSVL